MVDVTDDRKAGEAREDDDRRFRRLVERLPAIVYLEVGGAVGEDDAGAPRVPGEPGSLLYVSPQIAEILGFSPEEWVERSDLVGAPVPSRGPGSRVRAEYERVAHGERPFVAEYRMFARDGRVVWFHDEAVLIRDDDGSPLFWQGIMTDVTARRLDRTAPRRCRNGTGRSWSSCPRSCTRRT